MGKNKLKNPKNGQCGLCKGTVPAKDVDGNFCHGCRTLVCETCAKNPTLMGRHAPSDHLREDWD